jgi:hypothetical protein
MKILNNITVTRYSSHFQAHMESTFSIIRPYVLTYRGAARAIKNEHPGTYTKNLNITRIETVIYAR